MYTAGLPTLPRLSRLPGALGAPRKTRSKTLFGPDVAVLSVFPFPIRGYKSSYQAQAGKLELRVNDVIIFLFCADKEKACKILSSSP